MWKKSALEGIDLLGANLENILISFGSFTLLASKILLDEKLGRDDGTGMARIDPESWYPINPFLRAFERISAEYGEYTLRQVGLNVPKNVKFPPTVVDLESALHSIDVAYHMNHGIRGEPMFSPATGQMREGIGHYTCTRVSDRKQMLLESTTPYPCSFDAGIVQSLSLRFDPTAIVTHEPSSCRKRGGTSCTYVVTWR